MRKILFMIFVLISMISQAQIIRVDTLMTDTTGHMIIAGVRSFNPEAYIVVQDTGLMFWSLDQIKTSGNRIIAEDREFFFIHKDSIPTLYNQIRNWYINNFKNIVEDSINTRYKDWNTLLPFRP